MPLTRDKIVGYDGARMVFRFTMLNNAEKVECEISSAALDELEAEQLRRHCRVVWQFQRRIGVAFD